MRNVFSSLLLLLVIASSASAVPIIVPFSGTITSVTDPGGFLDPSIAVGSPFSGSYNIEPTFGGTIPLSGGVGYILTLPGSIQATVAAVPFTSPISGVVVADGFTGPGGGDVWGPSVPVAPGDIFINVLFQDTTGTKLASDAFFVNQDLAGWDVARFGVFRFTGGPVPEALAIGVIGAIPEPTTGLLLIAGLLGLAGWRSRPY